MKKLALTMFCTAILLATTACGSAQTAAPAVQAVPTFTQPAPTPTDLPSATPTPEIAEPSVLNGLQPQNAASQVLENGTWVTKNENGEVTATWNPDTSEWTYNMEVITIRHVVVGYEKKQSCV